MAPETDPETKPIVLLTFAETGGSPTASNVGKVIREPDPTIVLTAPAASPAAAIATASRGVTTHEARLLPRAGCVLPPAGRGQVRLDRAHRRPPGPPVPARRSAVGASGARPRDGVALLAGNRRADQRRHPRTG